MVNILRDDNLPFEGYISPSSQHPLTLCSIVVVYFKIRPSEVGGSLERLLIGWKMLEHQKRVKSLGRSSGPWQLTSAFVPLESFIFISYTTFYWVSRWGPSGT